MNRRKVLSGGAAFATINLIPRTARAAQFEYKLAHNQPVNSPMNTHALELANTVKDQTGGRLIVTVFPASVLGGDTAVFTQLRSGAVQFFALAGGIFSSLVPVAQICQIPFAFRNLRELFTAMDGRLGEVIRREVIAKDIYIFEHVFDNGFRQITSSTHPIRNVDDLSGFKVRVPPGRLSVDLFKSLGAEPTAINLSEVYTAMQTHVVDGQENPYQLIELFKFYEVQKYLSVTNHMWDAPWPIANMDAWKALPPDIQGVVTRAMTRWVLAQRRDIAQLNDSLSKTLQIQGMAANVADTASFKAKLSASDFYKRWKGELGQTAWDALESYTGKLA